MCNFTTNIKFQTLQIVTLTRIKTGHFEREINEARHRV